MILSQTAVYALKAALYLAGAEGEELVRVDDMARALGVPRNYLAKILHTMARSGLLTSTRGPGGGFRLRMDAWELTLEQVVEPFDDVAGQSGCLLGSEGCSDAHPCAAHSRWCGSEGVSSTVQAFFRETTVLDLSKEGAAHA